MYYELSCYDRVASEDDVREAIFIASQKGVKGLSLMPYFFASMKDFLIEGMTLSCPIDYPYGHGDISVRNHAILTAIRKGANTLDIVANNPFIFNNKLNKLGDEIESHYRLCYDNKVVMRLMLEYRLYSDELITKVAKIAQEIGVEYIFPATGGMVDNLADNLTICMLIQEELSIQCITNTNIWRAEQLKIIEESGVFGVRFQSLGAVKNLLLKSGVL